MKLYSYIVAHDTGFAPNPFWRFCTTACCKPVIRRTANKRDWIVGLSPKRSGNRIIFAMEVTEDPMPFDQYFKDKRFKKKIPDLTKKDVIYKCGDNIYQPISKDKFKQLPSQHSNGKKENIENKKHDLGGKNVLISNNFYYFGTKALSLPKNLSELIVGRGHRSRFSEKTNQTFLKFISKQKKGINNPPFKWPATDKSWKNIL